MNDPLLDMAMRASAMLATLTRAAEVMAAPVGGSAVWRPVGGARTQVQAADVPMRGAAVRIAAPQGPHPGIDLLRSSIPQVGEGEGRGRRVVAPRPTFPLPLVGEGGAQRRVRVAAADPAPARTQMPAAPFAPPAAPQPTAPVPPHEAMPRGAPQNPVLASPSPPPASAQPAPPAAASPTPWSSPPDETPPDAAPPFDDSRLARWLSDHLAAETRRPARGGTGFDPRLSPAWPGTLQGPWGWGG